MSGQVYRHRHRVTYAECTVGNHVYYARYLDIIETARGEFLRNIGHSCQRWHDAGLIFPVLEAQVRYHRPARYDDELVIEVTVTEARRVRLGFAYRILDQNDRLLAESVTQHVCTDLTDKPRRLPEEFATAVAPFLVSAEHPEASPGAPAPTTATP